LLTDPIEITLGAEQTLPTGVKVIKPNVGCVISSLKKNGESTNYATTWNREFTSDNYFYIGCGGANRTWEKVTGTGTIVCFK